MGNRKRIIVFVVVILFMFCFITFAGGTPQNQAIATRNVTFIDSYNNAAISEQRVIVGEDAEVPENPRHDNLVFVGWYLEEDRTQRVTDFTNITSNIRVLALYGADRNGNGVVDDDDTYYTVRFVDTFDNTEISSQRVLVGMNATAPVVPTHVGQTFTGWDRGYTNITGNTTVSATWRQDEVVPTINRYNVTFVDSIDESVIAVVSVEEGLTANTPAAPEHKGYVHVGWEGNFENVTSNQTVRAIYAVDSNENGERDDLETRYVVAYNAGYEGVTGEAPKSERTYLVKEVYTVLENTFELKDATFIGWSENEVPKIITTLDEAKELKLIAPNSTFEISKDVELYAVWARDVNGDKVPDYEETQYSLTYVVGTIETKDETTYVKGEKVTLKSGADLSTNEYKFIGWSKKQYGTITKENHKDVEEIEKSLIEDITFADADEKVYAVKAKINPATGEPEYLEDPLTLTYVVNGTETEDSVKYVKGETVTLKSGRELSTDAVKFIGWSKTQYSLLTREDHDKVDEIKNAIITEVTFGETDETVYAVMAKVNPATGEPEYLEEPLTLTYVTNGVSTVDAAKYVKGETVTLKSGSDLTTDTVKFIGWSKTEYNVLTKADHDKVDEVKKAVITEVTFGETNETVYAIMAKVNPTTGEPEYLENPLTLTYVVNGTETEDSVKYVEGETVTLKDGTRLTTTEVKFLGWSKTEYSLLTRKDHDKVEEIKNAIITEVTFGETDEKVYAVMAKVNPATGEPEYLEEPLTLTYVANGASTVDTAKYVKGEKVTLKSGADLTTDTVKFLGWSKTEYNVLTKADHDKVDEVKNAIITEVTFGEADETVYAVMAKINPATGEPEYTETPLTLTYVVNGTETEDSVKYVKGEKVTLKDGTSLTTNEVKFIGWSKTEYALLTKADYAKVEEVEKAIITEVTFDETNEKVYAVMAKINPATGEPEYTETPLTLTYVVNGTETNDSVKYVKGETVTLKSGEYLTTTATKFIGWSKTQYDLLTREDHDKVEEVKNAIITEVTFGETNETVYAVMAKINPATGEPEYAEDQYTLTIKYVTPNGQTYKDMTNVTFNDLLEGDTVEIDVPANKYYDITVTADNGALISTVENEKATVTMPGATTVVTVTYDAKRDGNTNDIADEEEPYTVNFYNGDKLYATQEVIYGDLAVRPEVDPTKAQDAEYTYEFIGWTPELTAITEDTAYYAEYDSIKRKYDVHYYDYYGNEITDAKENIEYGSLVTVPTVPTEIPLDDDLLNFTGWSTDPDTFVAFDLTKGITGETKLYASYKMVKSSSAILYGLDTKYIRQEDGNEDDRGHFSEFKINDSLVNIGIKDDEDGTLAKIMIETEYGEEGKLAVGKDEIRKYLTEDSLAIFDQYNIDAYVLKYCVSKPDKRGRVTRSWHIDFQENKDDIAVYRKGDNGLKIVSKTHNIVSVTRYSNDRAAETKSAVNQGNGVYYVEGFNKNIVDVVNGYKFPLYYGSGNYFVVNYDDGKTKTVYWDQY